MDRNEKIREEVEKTLNATEKINELETNEFLFTRLESEIENFGNGKKGSRGIPGLTLKPAALFLFLLLNIFTTFYIINSDNKTLTSKKTYLSAISAEYNLNHAYNSGLNKLMGE